MKHASLYIMVYITALAATLIAALLTFSSCERRPLEESFYETARLMVEIDWAASGLDPDNDPAGDLYSASIWVFAKEGTPFQGKNYNVFPLEDPRGGVIEVPPGHYALIIHNNYYDPDKGISEFSQNVAFRFDAERPYETFEYYALPDNSTTGRFVTPAGQARILPPDRLVAWHLDEFEVTKEMIATTRPMIQTRTDVGQPIVIHAAPQPMLYTCHVIAHVNNISSAKASLAILNGMAGSVFPVTGIVGPPATGYVFSMNNRRYDEDSQRNGTIEATFYTFGPLSADIVNTLHLDFTLVEEYDGQVLYPTPPATPFQFNVTPQVDQQNHHIEIRIGFGSGSNPDPYESVELPQLNVEGQFDVWVNEWGEEQPVEVPV